MSMRIPRTACADSGFRGTTSPMAKLRRTGKATDHPTYPNPTIIEALCEIHFAMPDGVRWEASLLGEMYKAVQAEFPIMEPVQNVGVSLEFGAQGFAQRLLPGMQQARYIAQDKSKILQLSEAPTFTVNRLPKYPGWSIAKQDILSGWARAVQVLRPSAITRVGLRYINRLPPVGPTGRLNHWLRQTEYVPAAVLSSTAGFMSRLQVQSSDTDRLVVTIADVGGAPDEPRSTVFDIDCISLSRAETSAAALGDLVERLHDRVWAVFDRAATDALRAQLKEVPS